MYVLSYCGALGTLLIMLTVTDMYVAEISPECLDCLARVRPINGCISKPNVQLLCGDFGITDRFFLDCTQTFHTTLSYKECALDKNCSRQCVAAMHNRMSHVCVAAKYGLQPVNLTCGDYAVMHHQGIHSCGNTIAQEVQQILDNMTALCGCQVVYGKCNTPATPQSDRLIIIIVPAVCGGLLLIAIAVFIACCVQHHRRLDLKPKDHKRSEDTETSNSSIGVGNTAYGAFSTEGIYRPIPANSAVQYEIPSSQTFNSPDEQSAPVLWMTTFSSQNHTTPDVYVNSISSDDQKDGTCSQEKPARQVKTPFPEPRL